MGYNSMSHVGLEADYYVTKEMLKTESTKYHYGWSWKGYEIDIGCKCVFADCGLIARINLECYYHHDKQY